MPRTCTSATSQRTARPGKSVGASGTTIAVAVKPDTLATDFPAEIGLVMRAFVSACGITGAAGSNSTFDSLCPRTNDWHGGAANDAIESPGLLPKLAVNGDQNFK